MFHTLADSDDHETTTEVIKVLIVEDSLDDAALVDGHLGTMKWATFDVTHVHRFNDALARLGTHRYHLILLDLDLPDGAGPELVRQLRDAAENAAIVVLAGGDDELLERSTVQLGAQEFLHKHRLNSGELSRAIRHGLEREKLTSQVRSLVLNHVDATVVMSLGGVIQFANHAALSLFRKSRQEFLGSVFEYPLNQNTEFSLEYAGEDPIFAEIRWSSFDWMDETALLASIRDVTDRRRTSDLETKLMHADRLASIGRLAAGVAHEVNNPATYILANLHLLQNAHRASVLDDAPLSQPSSESKSPVDSSDEIDEMFRDSIDGMERIIKIVRELRTFSRLEPSALQMVDLNDVVRTAFKATFHELRDRAEVVLELGDIPPTACDRAGIVQILTNLLVNAAHAITEGRRAENQVTVSTSYHLNHVFIDVSDTGSGMSMETRQRIFEPFFTTKPQEHGTGLGLALSAEIARKHGGQISVESELGIGTTFRVTLPISSTVSTPESRPPRRHHATTGPSLKVLVIDDEVNILKVYDRILGEAHEVTVALGGAQAISILKNVVDFDVVMCDLMMADVDGPGVYQFLLNHAANLIPRIMFSSGGAFTPEARRFLEEIEAPILEKPVPIHVLFEMIERVARDATAKQMTDPAVAMG